MSAVPRGQISGSNGGLREAGGGRDGRGNPERPRSRRLAVPTGAADPKGTDLVLLNLGKSLSWLRRGQAG